MTVTIKQLLSQDNYLDNIAIEVAIRLKVQYTRFLCDCIYEDKLDDVQSFKDFCEAIELEEKYKWESVYNTIFEDDTAWF